MIRRPSWQWTIILAIVLLASGLLVVLLVPGLSPSRLLADRMASQLDTLPDAQVASHMRRVAELGDAGLPVVVKALANPRASVAKAAQDVLRDELDRWSTLEPAQSSPKVARLASLLAETAPLFDSAGKPAASDLAMQILLWPLDTESVDAAGVIADCETVLRATAGARLAKTSTAPTESIGATSARSYTVGDDAIPNQAPAIALPAEIVDVHSLSARLSDENRAGRDQLASAPVPADARVEAPLHLVAPPARSIADPPRTIRDGAQAVEPSPAQLRRMEHFAVMRALHARDPAVAAAAVDELARRDFQVEHVRLARQLTHPDAEKRRHLAELLPRTSGIDARQWLLWLSRDENGDVRAAALSILATSGDPSILAHVRERLREEAEPAVVRQVQAALDVNRR